MLGTTFINRFHNEAKHTAWLIKDVDCRGDLQGVKNSFMKREIFFIFAPKWVQGTVLYQLSMSRHKLNVEIPGHLTTVINKKLPNPNLHGIFYT